jgi:hypothetical protein
VPEVPEVKPLLVLTIIDQIAASDASISELRDIVAARPGATHKPRSASAPRHAIWINRETFISYVLTAIS